MLCSAHPLARPTGRLRRGSLRKLRFLRCIAAQTKAALGIFDIARHCVFTLFARAPACAPFGFSLRSKVPFESFAFLGASPLCIANPPAPVIGEVRSVILRRSAFPLRASKPELLVLLASRRARREPASRRKALAHSSLQAVQCLAYTA